MAQQPSQADLQTRRLFFKIEKLLYEAVHNELEDIVRGLVITQLEEIKKEAQDKEKTASAPSQPSSSNDDDPAGHIRQLIRNYVITCLEEEAPKMIAKTLSVALSPVATRPPPR
ncbi:MAG: hypothetical protein ACON49_02995 [Candidatus Puniceispirillaceae bacterium]